MSQETDVSKMTNANTNDHYQPFFCEENIWHLACENLRRNPENGRYEVLFLINAAKTVLLMNQSAFIGDGMGCWDYHVILWDRNDGLIIDFDSSLGFINRAEDYFSSTFPDQDSLPLEFRATVRSIDARKYVEGFWSDRTHMLDPHGRPLHTFPDWPPIVSESNPLRLRDLCDLDFKDPRMTDRSVTQFVEFAL